MNFIGAEGAQCLANALQVNEVSLGLYTSAILMLYSHLYG